MAESKQMGRKATKRDLRKLVTALKVRNEDRVLELLTDESPPVQLPKSLEGTVAADMRFLNHCRKILKRRPAEVKSSEDDAAGFYRHE